MGKKKIVGSSPERGERMRTKHATCAAASLHTSLFLYCFTTRIQKTIVENRRLRTPWTMTLQEETCRTVYFIGKVEMI